MAVLMKILEDATQEAVRRQAKVTYLLFVPLVTDGHTYSPIFWSNANENQI